MRIAPFMNATNSIKRQWATVLIAGLLAALVNQSPAKNASDVREKSGIVPQKMRAPQLPTKQLFSLTLPLLVRSTFSRYSSLVTFAYEFRLRAVPTQKDVHYRANLHL